MKPPKALIIGLISLIIFSCRKNEIGPGPKLQQETRAKILGKWQLQKKIVKEYQPIDILTSTIETAASAQDTYEFLESNSLMINSGGNQLVGSFKVWNPYQVVLSDESWFINLLSENQLILIKDRNYVELNKRVYMEMTFRR